MTAWIGESPIATTWSSGCRGRQAGRACRWPSCERRPMGPRARVGGRRDSGDRLERPAYVQVRVDWRGRPRQVTTSCCGIGVMAPRARYGSRPGCGCGWGQSANRGKRTSSCGRQWMLSRAAGPGACGLAMDGGRRIARRMQSCGRVGSMICAITWPTGWPARLTAHNPFTGTLYQARKVKHPRLATMEVGK